MPSTLGEYQEVRSSRGDREVSLRAMGTTNENMLKYVSGLSTKQVRAHLCGPACDRQVWEDGLIHCSKVCQHLPGDVPWERNLEVAPVEKERDDLERVRKEAASRGKGVGAVKEKPKKDRSSSPGTSGESKMKKKKKKKKKKDKLKIEAIKPPIGGSDCWADQRTTLR